MKILLASKRAPGVPGRRCGGVQTWIATVRSELQRRGHQVAVADVRDRPSEGFEVGIFANAAYTGHLKGLCGRSVLVTHGIVPDEAPAEGFGRVVFTSEEVRDHWNAKGPIIRQPIDLNFWRPRITNTKYLVRFSSRSGLDFVPGIAESMGLEYIHIKNSKPEQVREVLQQATVVLATGRAALEAMAVGCSVVICDDRTYQGPLLDMDTLGSMKRNFSGRGGVTPNLQNVEQAIDRAIERGSLRGHVEKHHGAAQVVDQLLCFT